MHPDAEKDIERAIKICEHFDIKDESCVILNVLWETRQEVRRQLQARMAELEQQNAKLREACDTAIKCLLKARLYICGRDAQVVRELGGRDMSKEMGKIAKKLAALAQQDTKEDR